MVVYWRNISGYTEVTGVLGKVSGKDLRAARGEGKSGILHEAFKAA